MSFKVNWIYGTCTWKSKMYTLLKPSFETWADSRRIFCEKGKNVFQCTRMTNRIQRHEKLTIDEYLSKNCVGRLISIFLTNIPDSYLLSIQMKWWERKIRCEAKRRLESCFESVKHLKRKKNVRENETRRKPVRHIFPKCGKQNTLPFVSIRSKKNPKMGFRL
jgi:hypothetical protein